MAEDRQCSPSFPQDIQSLEYPIRAKEYLPIEFPPQRFHHGVMGMAQSSLSGKLFLLSFNYSDNCRILVFNQEGAYVTSFGSEGFEEGELDGPHDLAVDSRGLLYVTHSGKNRIEVFTEDGNLIRQFGSGQLSYPGNITVHDELLYVADTRHRRISVYTLQGEHVCCIGTGQRGNGPGQFTYIDGIAFSPDGLMYVHDYWSDNNVSHRVQVFDRNGQYKREFALDEVLKPRNLAITSDGNNLLILSDDSVALYSTHENTTKSKLVHSISMNYLPVCLAIGKEGNILALDVNGIAVF